jgi:hypothetical protein
MKPQDFAAVFVRAFALLALLLSVYFFVCAHNLGEMYKDYSEHIEKVEARMHDASILASAFGTDPMIAVSDKSDETREFIFKELRRVRDMGLGLLLVGILMAVLSRPFGAFLCFGMVRHSGKMPNQSTDPTPASGTPPAGQKSRHP